MNILKTIYEKQEKGQEQYKKTIQSLVESIHLLVNRSRCQREFLSQNQNRYPGPSSLVLARITRKCFYCFGTDHLFLNYLVKNKDKQKGLILVDSFTIRFANRNLISTDPNLLIREYIKKHLLSLVAVMLIGNPDPELVEFLDRKIEQLLPEMVQLRNKVKNLEVMLQKLQTDSEPKPEKKDMEGFLKKNGS